MRSRRKTRQIKLGPISIGSEAPIAVQSMTNTNTHDVSATVTQVCQLEAVGCEMVRVAVPDAEAARAIKYIKQEISIPLIADIHFNYRLALLSMESGVDGLRLNPGNIASKPKVEAIVKAARDRLIPIRVGVNAGSLEASLLERYGGVCAQALAESALGQVKFLEDLGYDQIKISVKASHVPLMVEAYRLVAAQTDYPLHLGVTEAGTLLGGTVKSSVGLGILLAEGIGDTIRVSLTADPVEEVRVAYHILGSLGLRHRGIELISCPTCGRCQIDLVHLAEEVERRLAGIDRPLSVAVMGCPVNGPGEARQADVGIAGGRGFGLLFRQGRVIDRLPEEKLLPALLAEVDRILAD